MHNETIYAVSQKGIYSADVNDPNLIDFNNWLQPAGDLLGNFRSISVLDDKIFTCSTSMLYELLGIDELSIRRNYNRTILNLRSC